MQEPQRHAPPRARPRTDPATQFLRSQDPRICLSLVRLPADPGRAVARARRAREGGRREEAADGRDGPCFGMHPCTARGGRPAGANDSKRKSPSIARVSSRKHARAAGRGEGSRRRVFAEFTPLVFSQPHISYSQPLEESTCRMAGTLTSEEQRVVIMHRAVTFLTELTFGLNSACTLCCSLRTAQHRSAGAHVPPGRCFRVVRLPTKLPGGAA